MRSTTPSLFLVLALGGSALKQEVFRPGPVEFTAYEVMVAHRAGCSGRVRELAARDDPDPWLVADKLCLMGEREAAEAYARAARRRDTDRLLEYVDGRVGSLVTAELGAIVREAYAALDEGDAAGAWNALARLEGGKRMGAAAALKAAQAHVASHERWRHPRYWAAWVLWGLP